MDHIAVLVVDTPIAGVTEEFGDFGDNTMDLLKDCLLPFVKYQIAFDTENHTASDIKNLEAIFAKLEEGIAGSTIKGVAITGSRSDSFEVGNPWIDRLNLFIKNVLFLQAGFPIVGLCFGHQILARNLGCKVGRNLPEIGWECGTTTIAINKSILGIENSPFKSALLLDDNRVLEHINLVEFHRDIVYGLPTGSVSGTSFQSIGSTSKCSIQGLITETGPIKLLTFQGHPEFTTAESLRMLDIDYEKKLFDKAVYERLTYNTKNLLNQGPIMGKVIDTFFELHR